MNDIEDDQNAKHQNTIKDVEISFVVLQRAIGAAGKFGNAEDGTDEDEHAGGVESVHVLCPVGAERGCGRVAG